MTMNQKQDDVKSKKINEYLTKWVTLSSNGAHALCACYEFNKDKKRKDEDQEMVHMYDEEDG